MELIAALFTLLSDVISTWQSTRQFAHTLAFIPERWRWLCVVSYVLAFVFDLIVVVFYVCLHRLHGAVLNGKAHRRAAAVIVIAFYLAFVIWAVNVSLNWPQLIGTDGRSMVEVILARYSQVSCSLVLLRLCRISSNPQLHSTCLPPFVDSSRLPRSAGSYAWSRLLWPFSPVPLYSGSSDRSHCVMTGFRRHF